MSFLPFFYSGSGDKAFEMEITAIKLKLAIQYFNIIFIVSEKTLPNLGLASLQVVDQGEKYQFLPIPR